jgi:hypothetical protein
LFSVFNLIEECLREDLVFDGHKELHTLRYFYTRQERGRYTCGVVARTMASLLREQKIKEFSPLWHDGVRGATNPFLRAFLAEQICLSYISAHGLPTIIPHLTKMDAVTFTVRPRWEQQIEDGSTLRLYIPLAYNFRFAQAVILWLNVQSKHAHVYPIQFTFANFYNSSARDFYTELWPSWSGSLEAHGLKTSLTFLRIGENGPTAENLEPVALEEQYGAVELRPEYRSLDVSVYRFDRPLYRKLRDFHESTH